MAVNDNEFVYVAIVLDVILYAGLDRDKAFHEAGEVGDVYLWCDGDKVSRSWVREGKEYSVICS